MAGLQASVVSATTSRQRTCTEHSVLPPALTIQQLLASCRPHQRREQEALALIVQASGLVLVIAG